MALEIDPNPEDQPVQYRQEPPAETTSLVGDMLNVAVDLGAQADFEVVEEGVELALEAAGEVIAGIFDFLTS